jgi:hypothetical protein
VTQRRTAWLLKINRATVARKLVFLGLQSKLNRLERLKDLILKKKTIKVIQFDEMETFERSKCLPLSIALVVEEDTRKILGFRVAEMPAKGLLAAISRKKYGKRKDERAAAVKDLFTELRPLIDERALITTDQNPKYPGWVKAIFPELKHKAVKGRRGCVTGQGEMKKIGFDPLFSLNQTCAMIRSNVSRMARRTWCTTKRRDRLEAHLELYLQFHNQELT